MTEPSAAAPKPRKLNRNERSPIDGILAVAKPAGMTSHDVVAVIRRLSGTRRIGHGGTLDPFATGLLVVFLGRATRLVEFHAGARKSYRAEVCFGARSTTDDLSGELTPVEAAAPDRASVEAALTAFRGTFEQTPPDYSAVSVDGRRAYAIARSGDRPRLAARSVTVDRLELVHWDDADPARPIATLELDCSAGTYVRAIARDLGEALGCGAYLGALTRTASGDFRLHDATSLDDLRAAVTEPAGVLPFLLPLDTGLESMPRVRVSEPEIDEIARGRFVSIAPDQRPAKLGPDDPIRVVDPSGRLIAIAHLRAGRIAPSKVLVDPVPSPAEAADSSDSSDSTDPTEAAEAADERG